HGRAARLPAGSGPAACVRSRANPAGLSPAPEIGSTVRRRYRPPPRAVGRDSAARRRRPLLRHAAGFDVVRAFVTDDFRTGKASAAVVCAGGLAVATGLTCWFGLRATREWERSTITAADTRGNEVVTLLGVALERDMKGGQTSVLLKMSEQDFTPIAPYELAD